MPANLENSAVATRLEKVLFSFQWKVFIPISFQKFSFQSQRRAMPKNIQTTTQLCLFHILAKKCSKSFKLGFNSTWTENFQIYKLDLEKAEEPGNKSPTSVGSTKKQEDSRKTSTTVSLTRLKPWLCGSEQTGKFFKSWEYQSTLPASWEICMQVTKQHLEPEMGQQTGSKWRK